MMRFESESQGRVSIDATPGAVYLCACAGSQELVEKLASELAMEQEMRDPKDVPQHLTDYVSNSSFKVCRCVELVVEALILI